MTYLKIEDLTMMYQEKPVIWDISIDIPNGTRTAIIGPNGAGKSTLLKGILNIVKPVSGVITLEGKKINKKTRKKIAYVPQVNEVNWDFPTTVYDVVMMGRYVHHKLLSRITSQDKQIVNEALEIMGMTEYKNRHISELSGGQKQRVFIARAIAQEAELYIMDEPLQGIDLQTEKLIVEFFKKMQKDGKTIIAVHHNLETVDKYFDYLIMINKTIISSGKMEDVFIENNLNKIFNE